VRKRRTGLQGSQIKAGSSKDSKALDGASAIKADPNYLSLVETTKQQIGDSCTTLCEMGGGYNLPDNLYNYVMALIALAQERGLAEAGSTGKTFTASNEEIALQYMVRSGQRFNTAERDVKGKAREFFKWQEKKKVVLVRRIVGGCDKKTGKNEKTIYEVPALDLLAELQLAREARKRLEITTEETSDDPPEPPPAAAAMTHRHSRKAGNDTEERGADYAPRSLAGNTKKTPDFVLEIIEKYAAAQSDRPAQVIRFPQPRPPRRSPTEATGINGIRAFQQKFGTAHGQLWEIPSSTVEGGKHVLKIGDCLIREDVDEATGGCLADVINTDPPYNVGIKGGSRQGAGHESIEVPEIRNDNMSARAFRRFLHWAFESMAQVLRPGGAYYIWHSSTHVEWFARYVRLHLSPHREILIWEKPNFALSRQDYHWIHEATLYGWKPGAKHHTWLGDRKQKTLWRSKDAKQSLERGLPPALHPTVKPVELTALRIEHSALPGGLVYDPFSGSGTTFAAAEHVGRLCAGLELDYNLAALVLERMERLGLQPRLIESQSRAA